MVMQATEQTDSPKLDEAISSDGEVNVSEDATEDTTQDDNGSQEVTEGQETDDSGDETTEITFTTEQESEIGKRIQAESDKKVNSYRETQESYREQIRTQQEEINNLKRESSTKTGETRLKRLMEGYDEEGHPEEGKKTFQENLQEVNKIIDGYNANSEQIEASADYIDKMVKGLDAGIVEKFNLNDPNSSVRAVHGHQLIEEAVTSLKRYEIFLDVLETHSQKGGEDIRKTFEEVVNYLFENKADYPSKKVRRDYIENHARGLKSTPKKAPPLSSGNGGRENLKELAVKDPEALLRRAFSKDKTIK